MRERKDLEGVRDVRGKRSERRAPLFSDRFHEVPDEHHEALFQS